ncbi:MAG TPA: hypothetical protein VFG76_09020, partial [Candidatus Polarisedimenticolia bacterium]|nr:hypothetical protein [Candidatus Polarisedimenticolia bacterium]
MIVGGAPRRLTAWRALICLTAVAVAVVCPAGAATRPAQRAHHAMVVGPEPLAVEEGLKILAEGGNAVDA